MNQGYMIRVARYEELQFLPIIERNAGVLFAPFSHELGLREDPAVTSVGTLIQAQQNGLIWVAANEADDPVGFAHVEMFGEYAHLHEIDVDPSCQRNGIGSALVREICNWADSSGISAITLRTFLHVPWNAPFYTKYEFRVIPDSESPFDELSKFVVAEATLGFNMRERVTMKRMRSSLIGI